MPKDMFCEPESTHCVGQLQIASSYRAAKVPRLCEQFVEGRSLLMQRASAVLEKFLQGPLTLQVRALEVPGTRVILPALPGCWQGTYVQERQGEKEDISFISLWVANKQWFGTPTPSLCQHVGTHAAPDCKLSAFSLKLTHGEPGDKNGFRQTIQK